MALGWGFNTNLGGYSTYGGWSSSYWAGTCKRSSNPQGALCGACTTHSFTWIEPTVAEAELSSPASGEPVVIPWGTVETTLEEDMAASRPNGFELARDALSAVGEGVEDANQDWPAGSPGSYGKSGLSDAQGAEVQEALNSAVSEDQLSKLYNSEPVLDDPTDPYGGFNDWEYSPEEIATAIDNKNRALLNDPSWGGHDEVPPEPPEKDDLREVLDGYWGRVAALPMLEMLDHMNERIIMSGGTSQICIGIPDAFGGGQGCYDMARQAENLNTIGALLMGVFGGFIRYGSLRINYLA